MVGYAPYVEYLSLCIVLLSILNVPVLLPSCIFIALPAFEYTLLFNNVKL